MQAELGQVQHMQQGLVWLLALTDAGWVEIMFGWLYMLSREENSTVWLPAPHMSSNTST
jgi:hypothetical protein